MARCALLSVSFRSGNKCAAEIGGCGKVEGSLGETDGPMDAAEPEIVNDAPDKGIAGTLDEVIEMLQDKLANEELKLSVGDLLRLLNIRKELMDASPRTVTVRWVGECEETPTGT
jgi:hypothetical protein